MTLLKADKSTHINTLTFKDKLLRFVWTTIWAVFARPIPRTMLNGWKLFLLGCFGAKVHPTAIVYSSAIIYAPWNLTMDEHSCIGPQVDCYSVDEIIIGAHSVVSQKTYLCTASHDITVKAHSLISSPIIIKDQVWVGADAFIGLGVTIEQGAVVGARACVFKNVDAWTVVGGNPAKFIKKREVKN